MRKQMKCEIRKKKYSFGPKKNIWFNNIGCVSTQIHLNYHSIQSKDVIFDRKAVAFWSDLKRAEG